MIMVELFAKPKPNDRHWYAYDLLLDGHAVVSNSRDPEHDLARVLLARGIGGSLEVRDGKTGKIRSTLNIEHAAKWSVGSNLDRYKWKPFETSNSSPPAGETKLQSGEIPSDSVCLPCAVSGFPQKNVVARARGSKAA